MKVQEGAPACPAKREDLHLHEHKAQGARKHVLDVQHCQSAAGDGQHTRWRTFCFRRSARRTKAQDCNSCQRRQAHHIEAKRRHGVLACAEQELRHKALVVQPGCADGEDHKEHRNTKEDKELVHTAGRIAEAEHVADCCRHVARLDQQNARKDQDESLLDQDHENAILFASKWLDRKMQRKEGNAHEQRHQDTSQF
eukprot:2746164-Prymnesium_polylepis.2